MSDALHEGAAADGSVVQQGNGSLHVLVVGHAVVASGHQHVPFLGAADRSGGLGDVWQVRQSGDVVQQAARLRVVGVAVGVAVLLLDVPPQLPALPLFQDLGLHLEGRAESVFRMGSQIMSSSFISDGGDSLLC